MRSKQLQELLGRIRGCAAGASSICKAIKRRKRKKKWSRCHGISRDQRIMALLLAALGYVHIGASVFYQPFVYRTANVKSVTASEGLWKNAAPSTSSDAATSVSTRRLSLDEMHLFSLFPEGAADHLPKSSIGGQIFAELMEWDLDWAAAVYSFSRLTPAEMTEKMGISKACIIGAYNPADEAQIADDPSTWIISRFRNVWFRTEDGDGNSITPYSNISQIMSLANVYGCYHDPEDTEAFLAYCKELWKASHYYTLVISDIYHCSGCVEKDGRGKSGGTAPEQEVSGTASEQESMETIPENGSIETGLEQESAGTVLGNEAAGGGMEAGSTGNGWGNEAAGNGMEDESTGTGWGKEAAGGSVENGNTGTVPGNERTGTGLEYEGPGTVLEVERTGNDSETEGFGAGAETERFGAGAETGMSAADSDTASASPQTEDQSDLFCPGHVDLTIVLRIAGLSEQNNLFALDATGNDENGYTEDGWQGWNEENRLAARRLAGKDWYLEYGLRTEASAPQLPVSSMDVDAYLRELPSGLSEERRSLLRFALNSVGRVPYYWGGKATAMGYEGNQFGTEVTPDSEGRSRKGLDCSGWISWVYWSATGKRLSSQSTTGLANVGRRIRKEELQPGDILVRTGANAHTVMFLGWTRDGRIQCVHETGGSVNNVTISIRDADWPYYIRLVE